MMSAAALRNKLTDIGRDIVTFSAFHYPGLEGKGLHHQTVSAEPCINVQMAE